MLSHAVHNFKMHADIPEHLNNLAKFSITGDDGSNIPSLGITKTKPMSHKPLIFSAISHSRTTKGIKLHLVKS